MDLISYLIVGLYFLSQLVLGYLVAPLGNKFTFKGIALLALQSIFSLSFGFFISTLGIPIFITAPAGLILIFIGLSTGEAIFKAFRS